MKPRVLVTALAVAAALVAAMALLVTRHGARGPGIILVSVDTLRPDHLGCYGYGRNTSPNLDAFARESLVFENCFSQAPTTRPSCASFLTGFLPHECRIFTNSDNLPMKVVTIAEYLKARGYRTLGVSSNFVLGKGTGYDRGFDFFDNDLGDLEQVRQVPERIASKTTDAAIKMLRARAGRKFFMWIHYQDPHGPYTPPAPYDGMFLDPAREMRRLPFLATLSGQGGIPSYQRLDDHDDFGFYVAQYDGEIAYFDAHFGRLLKTLKDMGLYDTSLVIFTADHGEGMGERDYFFAHGEHVYDNLIHVPLVVRAGGLSPGRRRTYVQLLDLVPTMLAFAGAEADPRLRGRNLLGESPAREAIFSEMEGKYSLIENGIKLIAEADQGLTMLFDLNIDPQETRNLVDDACYTRYVEPMGAKLGELLNQDLLGSGVTRTPANLTEDQKQKLKSLGYVN